MIEITMTIKLDEHFIGEVLITAFDGDLGACWYWASPANDGWLTKVNCEDDGCTCGQENWWTQCAIVDAGSDGPRIEWPVFLVDDKVIAKGITTILSTDIAINQAIRESIATAVATDDTGEIDADCADAIVQVGLFGELVYG